MKPKRFTITFITLDDELFNSSASFVCVSEQYAKKKARKIGELIYGEGMFNMFIKSEVIEDEHL